MFKSKLKAEIKRLNEKIERLEKSHKELASDRDFVLKQNDFLINEILSFLKAYGELSDSFRIPYVYKAEHDELSGGIRKEWTVPELKLMKITI
jgi:hypothetical protein